MTATDRLELDGNVVAERPTPGVPRPYEFPSLAQARLGNGLSILVADLPGRPLVSASVVIPTGAVDEPADEGGAAVLAARALTEGTERYDAVALIEASERLGASIHADAGWDATSVSIDVPTSRLRAALELLAEVLLRPTFPPDEVERLRDERLNDLLQAQADPRRRADEAFIDTIYSSDSPYHRPSGGSRETVERLDAGVLRRAYARTVDPSRATLVVAGDLGGQDAVAMAHELLDAWTAPETPRGGGTIVDTAAAAERRIRVVHRPGSVQTEIRIGHPGLPRRIPDFHAVSVMSAILGGLFNSRLNMQLREAKGYTYGASAGFDMRRGAGPFSARAAVNTEVTVPAVLDTLAELERMRDTSVQASELAAARDFLVGVFPLRFETPGAVAAALSGLAIHGLPVEELIEYRRRIEAVGIDEVAAAAREHLRIGEAAIVLVGDADAIGPLLEAARLGAVEIEHDDAPHALGPISEAPEAAVDQGEDTGPTVGAKDPDLPGTTDEPAAADADAHDREAD